MSLRLLPLLLAALLLSLSSGCRTGRDDPPSPLHVASTTPADGDLNVEVAATLEITFSVAVAPESVEGTGQILLQDEGFAVIPATVTVDPDDATRVTVDPTQALADGTTFGLAIRDGVATPNGERIAAPVGVKFSTGNTLAAMPGWPPFANPAPPPATPGTFVRADNEMSVGRQDAAAAVLTDGRVFIHGGRGTSGGALGTADLYRPATDDFALGGSGGAPVGRWGHTATLLADGTVLLVGGDSGSAILSDTPAYDPATDSYPATTLSLATARTSHTATTLTNGQVLVVGGWDGTAALGSCELYDPTGATWSTVGALTTARAWHSATLLSDGRVLAVGGGTGTAALGSAEIYDPATTTWTATGILTQARQRHTATRLVGGNGSGLVLVVGGEDPGAAGVLASATVFDPAGNSGAGTFTALVTSMGTARTGHTATFLTASNTILLAGGSSATLPAGVGNCQPLASAEILDPFGSGTLLGTGAGGVSAQSTFSATSDPDGTTTVMQGVAVGRASHIAALLGGGGGGVLLAGGTDCTGSGSSTTPYALPTGERYITVP